MNALYISICMLSAVLLLLPSCEGNVLVRPDVSKEMHDTEEKLKAHLDKEKNNIIGIEDTTLNRLINESLAAIRDSLGFTEEIPDGEIDRLADFLIPPEDDIELWIDVKEIPYIDGESMKTLLYVDKPQDIDYIVNGYLSQKVTGNARDAVGQLYEAILLPFFGSGQNESEKGIFAFRNLLHLTDDYSELTNGDYIAIQLLITLIFQTIPESVIVSYRNFEVDDEMEGGKVEQYISRLGDNMIKAFIVDRSTIAHIVSTYTFLNKYNRATTIIDMRNLGQIFQLEEEEAGLE